MLSMRWSLLLALGLLNGCASLTKPVIEATDTAAINAAWAARQQQLSALSGFEAIGRVAVKGGGLSGALRWQQEGEVFHVRIAGPFGAGALSMEGTPAQVAIKGKDIDLVTDQPEQVLAARTGWRLPLGSLRWWVLGLPAPDVALPASVTLDDQGRALALQQNGWMLRYSNYREDLSPAMPGRIEASQGEWSATVVLESLTLTP